MAIRRLLLQASSEDDAAGLAGGVGDGRRTGFGGTLILDKEAFADVAESGEDPCGADTTCTGEAHDDLPVGQFGGRVAAAVAVLGEEAGEALGAEARGTVWCWVATEEGQRDRAADVGENGGGTAPEDFEQGAERPDLGRGWPGRPETMPYGAQDIGGHEGVAGVGLAAGVALAGPAGPEGVGRDRDDRMAGLDKGIDNQAGRSSDGDWHFGRHGDALEAGEQVGEAGGIVVRLEAPQDGARRIEDADGVAGAALVETRMERHGLTASGWGGLARAGRFRGLLTDRRSGWHALARHPVVRLDLPAPAARWASCGLSSGKRGRPSRQAFGLSHTTPLRGSAPNSRKVHQ